MCERLLAIWHYVVIATSDSINVPMTDGKFICLLAVGMLKVYRVFTRGVRQINVRHATSPQHLLEYGTLIARLQGSCMRLKPYTFDHLIQTTKYFSASLFLTISYGTTLSLMVTVRNAYGRWLLWQSSECKRNYSISLPHWDTSQFFSLFASLLSDYTSLLFIWKLTLSLLFIFIYLLLMRFSLCDHRWCCR